MKPFPIHMFENRAILESALVYMTGMEAMVFLYGIAIDLLGGICLEMKEVNVSVTKPKLRICFNSAHGPSISTPQSMYHNVYRVVLTQGEVWAIDPTGAQFGYYEPLCSWGSFQQRISKVNRVMELGYIRHKVFYNFAKHSVEFMVSRQAAQEDMVKKLEEWFLAREELHSGRFNGILQEPEATFESAKHEFLKQLDSHVKRSLTGIYTPAETAKRKKKVDARLAQNPADPSSRKEFQEYLKFVVTAMGNLSS
ncbi:set domain-containing protein 5 [Paraphaeosphaeria minitans]|uniref:Set domain-containing protein 5 n=1 Tax=Paraphaeosphaeria minitans TaxID=565426 RepID=A0A9P6GDS6_9PLEO|nr:set domain-containing protein 5 [Paraphaeosphaeria minitans]